MKDFNVYENRHVIDTLGKTLRPGGFELTDSSVEFLEISENDLVLDIGCGMGATVNYLYEKYGITAYGIDISDKLLKLGKRENPHANLFKGSGDDIPFENEVFDYVFAECTFSLMKNVETVIKEANRVLKKNGWIVVSDVYAKESSQLKNLKKIPINTCMRGLHNLDILSGIFMENGFEIAKIQDCSYFLKELMVKIVFEYGSMNLFWCNSENKKNKDALGINFQEDLKKCKPGYFILFARKES